MQNHTLSESALPWRRLRKLWHVGTLNPAHKGKDSIEGNGLSVSQHPQEWSSIARLGNTVFTLSRPAGRFLDFRRLKPDELLALQAWGLEAGYLSLRPFWELRWTDGEDGDTRFTLFQDEAKARDEAEFMKDEETEDVVLELVQRAALAEQAFERLGFKLDPLCSEDIVATFWVEDCTNADGVWWQDRLDPYALSAPRGVINLKQLPNWQVAGPKPLR